MVALPFPHSQTVLVVTVQPERSTLVREKTLKTFPISPIIRTHLTKQAMKLRLTYVFCCCISLVSAFE